MHAGCDVPCKLIIKQLAVEHRNVIHEQPKQGLSFVYSEHGSYTFDNDLFKESY